MESLVTPISLGIVAFASTNIDDLFVLVTLLADKLFRVRDVVIGQYAGLGALYIVSPITALICLIVPASSVGLLGLVPIAIGIKQLWDLTRGEEEIKLQSVSNKGAHRALAVAAVTMANGGDNIAVYTALFATRGNNDIFAIGIVFAILTGLWCFAAHWFVNHRALGAPIRQQAHRVVPFVFIGLGILILVRTGALHLWK